MARWGNEAFAPAAPHAEVLFGIAEHDNGWEEWDQAPKIHVESGYPLHFNELAAEAYGQIWRRGVERYRKRSPYASLLITLHTADLARRRLENTARREAESKSASRFLGKGVGGRAETATLSVFLAEMEARRGELTDALMGQAKARSDRLEAEIEANFRLLQIGDIISLMFCCGLSGPFTLEDVPTGEGGPRGSVIFEPVSEDTLGVRPYPFSEHDVTVAVPGRLLRHRVFASNAELHAHLNRAAPISLVFHLQPA